MTHPLKHCDNCAFRDAPKTATVCKQCVFGGQGGSDDYWKPIPRDIVAAPFDSANNYQVGGDHYVNLAVQPWKAMESWMSEEEFAGYLRGNVIKHIARYRNAGGVEDLKKARHYLDRLIEHVSEDETE